MSTNSDHARPNFENIKIERCEEGNFVEANLKDVMITSRGKLGILQHGLMHMEDYKNKMAQVPISEKQQGLLNAELSKKRRDASEEYVLNRF